MRLIRCFPILALLFAVRVAAQSTGTLEGTITAGSAPVSGANVALIARADTFNAITDSTGFYRIRRIPPGTYDLEITHVAYQKAAVNTVAIAAGQTRTQNLILVPRSLSLDEIVVNPGSFSVLEDDPAAPRGLTRAEIKAIPAVTDDIYRTVEHLPGVSGSDFLARFTVRGGDYDQVLVTLDGLELFEPFHLKDLGGGVLSIVDAEVVGGLDMMTGGFSADYGNRQSAVLEMRSRRPKPGTHVSASAGMLSARLFAQRGGDRWNWLVSARRGYPNLMVDKIDPPRDFHPTYYDLFSKLTYTAGNNTLGVEALWAADSGGFTQLDNDHLESTYGNGYTWLTWDAVLGSGFVVRTLPYYGRITEDREGTLFNSEGDADQLIDDIRTTTLYGLKSDAKWQFGEHHMLRMGFDMRHQKADYDYRRQQRRLTQHIAAGYYSVVYDTVAVDLTPTGWTNSAYLSYKWRILSPLTTDLGLRYDSQTYTDDHQISPRAGLALSLGDATVMRAAWGRYNQAQYIGALDVQNGVNTFQHAARATHYVLGLEHKFGPNTQGRIEAYYKAYDHMWSRYENLNQNQTTDPLPDVVEGWVQVFPETGAARGIELYLKRDTGKGLNWWISYALTSTRETYAQGRGDPRFQGQTFPRAFDQTHSLSFDLIYRPASDWYVGMSWEIHTGWPNTPLELTENDSGVPRLIYSDFYSARYPLYHRLDVKLTHWAEYNSWRLVFGLGMSNFYNRPNVRNYTYFIQDGTMRRLTETWLPALPFFSVSAEF